MDVTQSPEPAEKKLHPIGIRACSSGHSVRYTTSAELIETLTSALADKSLPKKLREYTRPDLLVVDEFGFDRIERMESPQSASLFYKVVDQRHGKGSIALVTNINFDTWGQYLGDAPLSMALLDRLIHHATIIKIPDKPDLTAPRLQSAGTLRAKPKRRPPQRSVLGFSPNANAPRLMAVRS